MPVVPRKHNKVHPLRPCYFTAWTALGVWSREQAMRSCNSQPLSPVVICLYMNSVVVSLEDHHAR